MLFIRVIHVLAQTCSENIPVDTDWVSCLQIPMATSSVLIYTVTFKKDIKNLCWNKGGKIINNLTSSIFFVSAWFLSFLSIYFSLLLIFCPLLLFFHILFCPLLFSPPILFFFPSSSLLSSFLLPFPFSPLPSLFSPLFFHALF